MQKYITWQCLNDYSARGCEVGSQNSLNTYMDFCELQIREPIEAVSDFWMNMFDGHGDITIGETT